jgi:hypothetical protein
VTEVAVDSRRSPMAPPWPPPPTPTLRIVNHAETDDSEAAGGCAGRAAHLPLLLGRADQHLIHRDVPGARDDIADGVGDVAGFHALAELAADAS